MHRHFFIFMVALGAQSGFTQILPKVQSFEGGADDNWSFTANPPAYSIKGYVWGRVSAGGEYFSPAPDGSYFWEFYDIDEIPDVSADKICHLTFETIDLLSVAECVFSFDYCNRGLDAGDYMSYTLMFDTSNNWESVCEVVLPKHPETLSSWFTIQVSVPAEAQHCRLRLSAKANAAADCGGFDNIQLKEGQMTQPKLTVASPANGAFFESVTASVNICGTSTNLAGWIVWSNALNSTQGELAAACDWCALSVPLAEGENSISLTATNAAGLKVVKNISLLRGRSLCSETLGRIAFVAFNSDADSFAFVALEELPAGVVVRFCDSEWKGVNFGTFEGELVWSNSTATAAGAVIAFYGCDKSETISNNIGRVVSGTLALAKDGEEIYAYCGSVPRVPTAFLAAISTANSNLNGTGLVYGETAVAISKTPASQYYRGARRTQKRLCDYLLLINNSANWATTVGVAESWGDAVPFARASAATVIMVR